MKIVELHNRPNSKTLASILNLYQEIFGDSDAAYFHNRINTRSGWLTLLSYDGKELVGFKMGYALDDATFYSWLGGVKESYRGKGLGQQLMDLQLKRVQEMGYTLIRTKTRNRFRQMLILNLRNGFDIVNCYEDATGEHKITLEKKL